MEYKSLTDMKDQKRKYKKLLSHPSYKQLVLDLKSEKYSLTKISIRYGINYAALRSFAINKLKVNLKFQKNKLTKNEAARRAKIHRSNWHRKTRDIEKLTRLKRQGLIPQDALICEPFVLSTVGFWGELEAKRVALPISISDLCYVCRLNYYDKLGKDFDWFFRRYHVMCRENELPSEVFQKYLLETVAKCKRKYT